MYLASCSTNLTRFSPGVSPMGIFWSMVQAPGQREGLRLMKKDMDTPLTTNISVYDGHLSADDIHDSSPNPICQGCVDRWYKDPGVKKQVVTDGRLRGILFLPAGTLERLSWRNPVPSSRYTRKTKPRHIIISIIFENLHSKFCPMRLHKYYFREQPFDYRGGGGVGGRED